MKEEKNLVVGDEIELIDDQLENVVGGIDFHNGQNRFESIKIGVACTSCGSANVVKSFRKRSVATYQCQDCGFEWEERPF